MKTNKKLLLIVITLIIAFTGCKKYSDGPTFSPWPKKWRVVNTWKEEKEISGGVTVSINNSDTYQYKRNGDFIVTSGSTSFTGTWAFGSKKETLITTFTGGMGSLSTTSKILRLTSKEMWLTDDSGNTETHFVSAK